MSNMEAEDRIELMEQVEAMIGSMLEVEANQYRLQSSQYDAIFRSLHNLKGTLGMLGADSVVIELLHQNEELFKLSEQNLELKQVNFEILYKSALDISDYITSGKMPQSFSSIATCTNCKNDPVKHMPEVCKNEHSLAEQNFNFKAVYFFTETKMDESSKILLIDEGSKKSQIESELQESGTLYDKINCLKEIYKLGPTIQKYQFIFINTEHAKAPVSLVIKVIQRVNKSCKLVLFGNNFNLSELDDLSEIHFQWIGQKQKNWVSLIRNMLQEMTTELAG